MANGSSRKKINLALQGGGAYGAFTWGVLDYMLEDGRLEIEAAATPMRPQRQGKGVVAVPQTELPKPTAAEVRETLERNQR